MNGQYVGSELELFAQARNWKAYWSGVLRPYLGRKILDVGAGIGGTAKAYPALDCERYLALEPDLSFANRMRADFTAGGYPQNFEVAVGTTSELPAEDRFDTILYIDVLEHISDDRAELERASAHLAVGGRIVILAPAHQSLYSEFDAAIGHVKRYNIDSLVAAKPDQLIVERAFYLDCVGLIASVANRLILKASTPSAGQIKMWDGTMVPCSKVLDRLIRYKAGKTVVAIFKRSA